VAGSTHGLIGIPFQRLVGGIKENHDK